MLEKQTRGRCQSRLPEELFCWGLLWLSFAENHSYKNKIAGILKGFQLFLFSYEKVILHGIKMDLSAVDVHQTVCFHFP